MRYFIILYLSISFTLLAAPDFLHRPAEKAPIPFAGSDSEGDEIDQEIENYFRNVKSGRSSVDAKRLHELFGSDHQDTETTEKHEEGSFTFSNLSGNDSSASMKNHRVLPGDTLYSIGRRYNIAPDAILRHNPELAKRPLYIGEEILLSNASAPVHVAPQTKTTYYTAKKGDSLMSIARKFQVSHKDLAKWNQIRNGKLELGQKLRIVSKSKGIPQGYAYRAVFEWPVKGPITSSYGTRPNPFDRSFSQFHKGIDIGVPIGTPFRAARDGIVILSARMAGYGNCIFIRHTNGYVTVYGHNKVNLVKQGDVVKQGQVIGEVGRTGTATGPHLHFEVRKATSPMNPFAALNLREVVMKNADTALKEKRP